MKNMTIFKDKKQIIKKTYLALLVFLCIISLLWFISSIKQLNRSGELVLDYNLRKHSKYPHNVTNVNNIKTWMTFDYINFIFRLNPMYLKNILMITDSQYPNINIDHYAKRHNLNKLLFLQNIKQIIINYNINKK